MVWWVLPQAVELKNQIFSPSGGKPNAFYRGEGRQSAGEDMGFNGQARRLLSLRARRHAVSRSIAMPRSLALLLAASAIKGVRRRRLSVLFVALIPGANRC